LFLLLKIQERLF